MDGINVTLKKQLEVQRRVNPVVTQGLLFLTVLLLTSSCFGVKRKEVLAEIWKESGLPQELCEKYPELKVYGKYRLLDSGEYDTLPYCQQLVDAEGKIFPAVQKYVSMYGPKFYYYLDAILPPKRKEK